MTTLAALKARIADDLARSDLTTQIEAAIADAIAHYQSTRFYFNETRSVTFQLVAGQSLYTVSDNASIPLFFEVDDIFITVNGRAYPLRRGDADELDLLTIDGDSSGNPFEWAWFDQSFRFYPVPNAVRTMRVIGAIKKAAPATDGESGNVWMTEAFELIRSHAKLLLAVHVIRDTGLAALMSDATRGAKERLEAETSKKRAMGTIRATQF